MKTAAQFGIVALIALAFTVLPGGGPVLEVALKMLSIAFLGVSRSGATITAGLFLGLDRAAAARFSFLLSVPAVVLSGLFEMRNFVGEGGDDTGAGALIVATLLAFVVGYASIAFLLRFLANHSTYVFVGYRVVLGGAVVVLAYAGTIS